MGSWNGQSALITGAGSGIGRALAQELAARGAIVTVTDVDGTSAANVAAELGGSARSKVLDVRDLNAFRSAVAEAAAPTGRLDALFNNAGIGVSGETQEFAAAHWQRMIEINVYGVINGVQAAYPAMIEQRSGHIINVASLAGLGAAPYFAPYAMSKHAVVGLSTSLRIEAARYGVKVSVLCPAAIETPLLDGKNPADLPPVSWRPNTRRYLTKLSGPPYPVGKFATEAVDAVERNEGIIVIPRRARFAWIFGRLFPKVSERLVSKIARRERAAR